MSPDSKHNSEKAFLHAARRELRARKDVSEFGPGKANFLLCPSCKAVYAGKHWRHDFPKRVSERKSLRFQLCPACRMAKEHFFEGEVILKHVPHSRVREVLQRVKHAGEQAYERDVLDRILYLGKSGDRIVVRTSENQLALRIAKAVQRLLKGKLNIVWSQDEDTVRILWHQ